MHVPSYSELKISNNRFQDRDFKSHQIPGDNGNENDELAEF